MIATFQELTELAEQIAPSQRIAVDTEADSLHCYFEKLCLIQISVPGTDVLVDPLAGIDLSPLFHSLTAKTLILHGADYDVRLFRRIGFSCEGTVFDTMLAARLTGHQTFNLAALVEKYFGVTLAKASQKANWARRPLTPKMLEYALNDTRYLLPLAEELERQLRELGRWEWLLQSCEKMVEAASVAREKSKEMVWRISGSGTLRGQSSAVLRALWHWRDEEAKAGDRPAFHIMRNEDLIAAATRFANGDAVDAPHVKGQRRARFFDAAERALALPESDWPVLPRRTKSRPTPEQENRFQSLKTKRDQVAEKIDLDPSLIAPRAILEAVAADESAAGLKLLPWQRDLLGL